MNFSFFLRKYHKRLSNIILLCVILTDPFSLNAQISSIDSLKQALKVATHDTVRVHILQILVEQGALKESKDFNEELKIIVNKNLQNEPENLFFRKSYAYYLDNKGNEYLNERNVPVALDFFYSSLKKSEEINDIRGISTSLNNIGLVYEMQNQYDKALKVFRKCLSYTQKINDPQGVAAILNNIGMIYVRKKQDDYALDFYKRSLSLIRTGNNQSGLNYLLNNIGNVYERRNEFSEALKYYLESLEVSRKNEDTYGEGTALMGIAKIKYNEHNFTEALRYSLNSMQIAKESGDLSTVKNSAQIRKDIFKKQHNYKEALALYELEIQMRDSIYNDNSRTASVQKELEYEYGKKEVQLNAKGKAEKEKILLKAAEEKRRQNVVIYSVLVGLLLVIIFLLFLFRSLQKNKKANRIITLQKHEVEQKNELIEEQSRKLTEKNKEVNDSVNYARGIQHALLASEDFIRQQVPDSFVLFKPKDTVSGDFYWFDNRDNLLLFAVADCTGHGVPGSMMSMIAINLLRLIVNEKNITSPKEVLFELDKKLTEMLHARGHLNMVNDGMDIAFVAYNKQTHVLHYSGANRPLWILQNHIAPGTEKLIEVKPDKHAIGGLTNGKIFTQNEILLQPGDAIYLTTDGYADQFGGTKGKKMMTKTLKDQLSDMSHLPMQEQKQQLDLFFSNWKGGHEQLDDVTVMGIKIM
jgi:serine phosphatase RsbU (regulator of sigma subunit)/Tfp pilus assembly protein PilF